MRQLIFFVLVPLLSQALELRHPCNLSVDLGDTNCQNTSSIRYYLDAETLSCLPFRYTGCGGNENNFESPSICHMRCIPMDYHTCPANRPPVKRADGSASCNDEKKCPEGSRCLKGFVVGLCCDIKEIDKYHDDNKPDCGHRKVVTEKLYGFPMTLHGKECEHNFCPKISECRKGHFYAYCCK
ncbi:unnamed protein product [Cylicocyclus nassatus]|uniref:BPTI/Kunitz inhibitor domain-containing protein n=1 Tax=Cylicocyclus nassatus TaxID=53992 RepID=A0AA36DSL5_CYLNA|nr:unnamed protein product [Cylicocyclus nassatus]